MEVSMVSAIATQHRHISETQPKAAKPNAADSPGKSAASVGHRAKAMVAETGDTDPGAQGRAASRIARMDLTLLSPVPPAAETPAEETPAVETPAEEMPAEETPVVETTVE
jgi:hypothetical protein